MSDLVWTLGWVPEPHFLHWDWSQTFIGTSYFNLKNPPNILTVTPRIQDEKLDTLVPQKFKTCKVGSFHCKRSNQITLCDRRKSQIWFARWTIKIPISDQTKIGRRKKLCINILTMTLNVALCPKIQHQIPWSVMVIVWFKLYLASTKCLYVL